MHDTSAKMAAMVAKRHRQMTPEERLQAASAMFDTARAIVESSLPATLSNTARRWAWAKRIYGNDLPEAMLFAFAEWTETMSGLGAGLGTQKPKPPRALR